MMQIVCQPFPIAIQHGPTFLQKNASLSTCAGLQASALLLLVFFKAKFKKCNHPASNSSSNTNAQVGKPAQEAFFKNLSEFIIII